MPFPMDLSHCLALAHAYEPLAITRIPRAAQEAFSDRQALRAGERVCLIADRPGHVLLEKPSGERLLLSSMQALLIEVEPANHGTAPTQPG